jgi:hypothetical protein
VTITDADVKATPDTGLVEETRDAAQLAMDEYKALVRRKALAAERSMGWPLDHLNRTLITLGLAPKRQFVVRIPVTGEGYYEHTLTGDEARSEAAARERAADMVSDQDLRYYLSRRAENTGGWTITRGEPQVIQPGVADTEPDPVALGTDLEAYKKLVRRVGIRAAKERDWCDSGTNEYLAALGLPLKQRFQVPVETTITARVHVSVDDAETFEEALARAAADHDVVKDSITRQFGARVTDIGAITAVSMDDVQVGDPDPCNHAEPRMCHTQTNTHNGNGRVYCTLPRDHTGQHVAGNGTRVLWVWPQS